MGLAIDLIAVGIAVALALGIARRRAEIEDLRLWRATILTGIGILITALSHSVSVKAFFTEVALQGIDATTEGSLGSWASLLGLLGAACVAAGAYGLVRGRLGAGVAGAPSLDSARADRFAAAPAAKTEKWRLQAQVDALPALIGYVDKEFRWQVVNKEYELWTGRRRGDLIGAHVGEVLGKSAFETVRPYIERALAGETVDFTETVDLSHSGVRHVRAIYVPDKDALGEVTGYYSFILDISDIKRAQDDLEKGKHELDARVKAHTKDLQRQRDFANSLVEAVPTIVLILSLDGNIKFVNPYFERLTGFTLNDVKGKSWFTTFVPARDRSSRRALFARAITAQATRGNVNTILTRTGEERAIEWSDAVLRDEEGQVVSLLAIGSDVTEKRRLEAEHAREHESLRQILDGMFAFVGLYSPDGILLEANRAPLEAANLERGDVIGKPFWKTYWWSHSTEVQQQVRQTLARAAQGEVVRDDFVVYLGENKLITIDAMFGPLYDENGHVTRIIGSGVDITERLQAETQLRESERRLTEAQRIAQLGSWELDLTLDTLTWTDEIFRIFEIDRSRFGASYEAFLNTIHPDDRAKVDEAYKGSLINRTPYDIVHRLRMPDGRIKWVKESCETDFAKDGKPLISRGTVQDITEQWITEQALRDSQATISGILEISEEAIILADEDLRIQLFSRGAHRVFGYDADEASGLEIERLIPDHLRENHRKHVKLFTAGEQTSLRMGGRGELVAQRKTGEEFPAAISLSKFQGRKGYFYSMIVRDISSEKAAQANLISAKIAAESASHQKSCFLANMSHELRTPLNAIIGFSDVIAGQTHGPVGNSKYAEYAADISKSGMHLLNIINDILDMSKIEAGEAELNESVIDVTEVLASSLSMVRSRSEAAGVQLYREIDNNLPALRGDERKLKQILINLLSNAIKFTFEGGEVRLKVWFRPQSGYVFQVADTGIGIALEDIPTCLTPFKQIDSDLNRRFDGTGLGLPLSKLLTEMHGGSLDLQSKVGVGTTVTVRLPADRAATEFQTLAWDRSKAG